MGVDDHLLVESVSEVRPQICYRHLQHRAIISMENLSLQLLEDRGFSLYQMRNDFPGILV